MWRLLRDLGRTIGRSLADFCVYAAPDGLVLDGILQNAGAPVMDGIRETLDQFAPPAIASQVRLAGGLLGDRAELVGAAVLAPPARAERPQSQRPHLAQVAMAHVGAGQNLPSGYICGVRVCLGWVWVTMAAGLGSGADCGGEMAGVHA